VSKPAEPLADDFMEEEVATLHDLGLTIVQAKAYLALARSGMLSIAATSNISKVPRTDLYRVIKELEKKGLVERVIANPTQFKAIPIDDCLDVLIQQRTAESFELQKKASKLRQNSKFNIDATQRRKDTSIFMLIPSNRAMERIGTAIDLARESVDVVVSWLRFSRGIFLYAEKLEKAWRRNVVCRFVIELPEKGKIPQEQVSFMKQNPMCRVKYVATHPQTVIGVYDNKEVFIIENPKADLKESPALWSNNSSLISLVKDFFEISWVTAMEDQDYKTDS
jgi:sugar-specific transcriptional regulator TrmB